MTAKMSSEIDLTYCEGARLLQDSETRVRTVLKRRPDGGFVCKYCYLLIGDTDSSEALISSADFGLIVSCHVQACPSLRDRRAGYSCFACAESGKTCFRASAGEMKIHLQSCHSVKIVQIGEQQMRDRKKSSKSTRTFTTVIKPRIEPWLSPVHDAKSLRPGLRASSAAPRSKDTTESARTTSGPADRNPPAETKVPVAPVPSATPVRQGRSHDASPVPTPLPPPSPSPLASRPKQEPSSLDNVEQPPAQRLDENNAASSTGSSTPMRSAQDVFSVPGGFDVYDSILSRNPSMASKQHAFSPKAAQMPYAIDINNKSNKGEGVTYAEAAKRSQIPEMSVVGKEDPASPTRSASELPVSPSGAPPPPPYSLTSGSTTTTARGPEVPPMSPPVDIGPRGPQQPFSPSPAAVVPIVSDIDSRVETPISHTTNVDTHHHAGARASHAPTAASNSNSNSTSQHQRHSYQHQQTPQRVPVPAPAAAATPAPSPSPSPQSAGTARPDSGISNQRALKREKLMEALRVSSAQADALLNQAKDDLNVAAGIYFTQAQAPVQPHQHQRQQSHQQRQEYQQQQEQQRHQQHRHHQEPPTPALRPVEVAGSPAVSSSARKAPPARNHGGIV